MTTRRSVLYPHDCVYLQRMMSKSQEELMRYAAGGFKELGMSNAFMARVSLLGLRNAIDTVLERTKFAEGFVEEPKPEDKAP